MAKEKDRAVSFALFNRYIWCIEIHNGKNGKFRGASLTDTYDVLKYIQAILKQEFSISLTDTYDVLK